MADDRASVTRILEMLERATPVSTWPEVVHPRSGGGARGRGLDPAATSAFLIELRTMLVREQPAALQLCTVVPDTWLGQSWEAQDLPTTEGRLGFAVRWHGDRPALLWELVTHDDSSGAVEITAPGLDPNWRSSEPRGEALLAPVAGPEQSGRPGWRRWGIIVVRMTEPTEPPLPTAPDTDEPVDLRDVLLDLGVSPRRHRPRRGRRHAGVARAGADRVVRRTALRPGRSGGVVRRRAR